MATINLVKFYHFCSYLHLILYLFAVHEFYYIKLIPSNFKNTRPMYLTTVVAYMPLPDTIVECYL